MLCAFAAIVAAALVGAFGFVVVLGVALLLGMVGLIWSIVALVAFRGDSETSPSGSQRHSLPSSSRSSSSSGSYATSSGAGSQVTFWRRRHARASATAVQAFDCPRDGMCRRRCSGSQALSPTLLL